MWSGYPLGLLGGWLRVLLVWPTVTQPTCLLCGTLAPHVLFVKGEGRCVHLFSIWNVRQGVTQGAAFWLGQFWGLAFVGGGYFAECQPGSYDRKKPFSWQMGSCVVVAVQLADLVIASGPHPPSVLGPSTLVLPSDLPVLAVSPSRPRCSWPSRSTPSMVTAQRLSSRPRFHISDLPMCRGSSLR